MDERDRRCPDPRGDAFGLSSRADRELHAVDRTDAGLHGLHPWGAAGAGDVTEISLSGSLICMFLRTLPRRSLTAEDAEKFRGVRGGRSFSAEACFAPAASKDVILLQ